ncbi:hypothetical protein D9Q98_008491 [Chlorella vulgaris]|uniref:Carbohydrate kinase PfkB domain-containing protein n=1 Tax=Chlorella vulgaris TaxID=3077 RepID=A0A9D4TI52_CHLVU|nr:hypothetical protein D9Q98_008491 [Chlorella vulgaris]
MSAAARLNVLCGHLNLQSASSSSTLQQEPCSAPALPPPPACGSLVLIGGMVMDLQAHPAGPSDVHRGGSVPGSVVQSAGGVARNVAEALALLLTSAAGAAGGSGSSTASPPAALPLLVSAVGDDLAGSALLRHWQELGLSTACIARLHGGATPTVAAVFDLAGELAACVADASLLEEQLTPQLLRSPPVAAALAAAPIVMLDGNLSPEALQEACRQAAAAGVPVWFEPVSAPKSVRAAALLHRISFVSPNRQELAAMAAAVRQRQQQHTDRQPCTCRQQPCLCGLQSSISGEQCCTCSQQCSCTAGSCRGSQCAGSCCRTPAYEGQPASSGAGAEPGAQLEDLLRSMLPDIAAVLGAGVQHVVLTLGPDGAALCRLEGDGKAVAVCHMPALPAAVLSCSGAGDCLVAGCLFALARGLPVKAALAHGIAASKAAVESPLNVPALDAAVVMRDAAALLTKQATRLHLPLPSP